MRRIFCAAVGICLTVTAPAQGQTQTETQTQTGTGQGGAGQDGAGQGGTGPVVVELYTSQGCSSCPPADAILNDLASRDDVIALSLHVDYWDYIGWKDVFANPAHTARQRAYAHHADARTIYTPQMIIDGEDHMVGAQKDKVEAAIRMHAAMPQPVTLTLARDGGTLLIEALASGVLDGPLVVQVVRYLPARSVEIVRGENAGRTLTYSNIVSGWDKIADWDGSDPLSVAVELGDDGPVAVLLQEPGPGTIVAAATLR